ncbi:hypothetical protein ANN_08076 [Periplaneta americana]|uniref:Uncharacterized protein n=1 Tax=Periplaneta americana TaxID=6978 RepID=A0ABQ8T0D3_PERAM|nr:hypothetical protein ANN_08076 [Periplaneta americana]
MKYLRRTAGYTLLDHKRNEDILQELNMQPLEEKFQNTEIDGLNTFLWEFIKDSPPSANNLQELQRRITAAVQAKDVGTLRRVWEELPRCGSSVLKTDSFNMSHMSTSWTVRSGDQEGYGNGVPREIRRSPKCRCRRASDSSRCGL